MRKNLPYIIVFAGSFLLVVIIMYLFVIAKPGIFKPFVPFPKTIAQDSTKLSDSTKVTSLEAASDSMEADQKTVENSHDNNPDKFSVDKKQLKTKDGSSVSMNTDSAANANVDSSEIMEKKRMAQLFDAMNAENAARILNQMSDTAVKNIIMNLKRKQAAKILSTISPERAARIMR